MADQMIARAAAIALALASLASGEEDAGYELLFQDATEEFSDHCIKASQPLPAWAHGDFIIPSIAQFEMGDRKFVGRLDAFGKMQRFELRGDAVCATYRMMATGFYNASKEANTIGAGLLFFETDPPRHCPIYDPICNMFAPNDNTFVNTFKHGDKLLSVTDAPALLEVDPKTMKVTGPFKFEDDLQGRVCYTGSAHPLPHPVTGDWIDFVGNAGILSEKATVRLYGLSDKDPHRRKSIADIVMDNPPYMHSFGLTPRHVVLPRMPIKFDSKAVATKPMHEAFAELDLDGPGVHNAFHVVPLDGGATRVYPLPVGDRLYYTHTVNTFENETGIVIDLCTLPSNPFAGNLTLPGDFDKAARDKGVRNVVKRFLLPHAEDEPVKVEPISDPLYATDFTKISPRSNGVKHCFYWGVQWFTDAKTYGSMAIVKYDVCGGSPKLQFHRSSWYPSEPSFIPSADAGAAEDEGLLVITALDGSKGETHVLLLNAATMELVSEAGPFPRVGFTTHGEFYPSAPAAATVVHV